MIQVPPQIHIFGDEALGREFIGRSKSQMNILRNQMRFQKLNQGARKVRLADNVYLECYKIYNTEVCKIIAIREKVVSESIISFSTHLLIVVGDAVQYLNLINVSTAFEIDEAISGNTCSGTITSVGFYDSEAYTQTLYGEFTDCAIQGESIIGVDSGAHGTIEALINWYFENSYKHHEFFTDDLVYSESVSEYPIFSSSDNSFPAKCPNNIVVENEWSKVLDKFMITAFTYYDTDEPSYFTSSTGIYQYHRYWKISASYNGYPVTFSGIVTIRGTTRTYDKVANFGNFYRTISNYSLNFFGSPQTHIGFDLWKDDVGDYFVSILSDQEATLYILKLSLVDLDLVLQETYYSTVRIEKYSHYVTLNRLKYVRLLGYGYDQENNIHKAYWGTILAANSDANILQFLSGDIYTRRRYYEENLITSEIITHQIEKAYDPEIYSQYTTEYLTSALWNPISRKLLLIYQNGSYYSEVTETRPTSYTTINLGSVFVGDFEYPQGSVTLTYTWEGSEETEYIIDTVITTQNACRINVEKLTFASDENKLAFTYSVNEIVSKSYCGHPESWGGKCLTFNPYDSCECLEYEWVYYTEGNEDILNAAAIADYYDPAFNHAFPYDTGWTSILFRGIDIKNNEYSNWIIYKDITNDIDSSLYEGYFSLDPDGNKYPLGKYDRAFFYNFTQQDED